MEKRLLSLLLALTLAFSLALPAFAEAAPAEQPGAEESAEAEEPAGAEEPSGDAPAEEPAPEPIPEPMEESANPTPDSTEESAQPTPEPTEGPDAPAEYIVTFYITVDGEKRDPIEKTFAPGAALALPEELKALKEAGYELAWYLDEALKEAVKPEEEPLFVTADLTLYVVAALPAAEEPAPETSEEPEEEPMPTPSEEPEEEPVPTEEPEEEPTPTPSEEPEEEPVPTEEPKAEPTPEPTPEEPKEPAPEAPEEPEAEPNGKTAAIDAGEVMPIAEAVTASGDCGVDLTWKLTSDGVLTISGTGAMANWRSNYNYTPWYDYRDTITSVKILSGVTSIGDGAFRGCDSLSSVTIPSSVTGIGDYAFSGCDSLSSVTISSGVTSIGWYAFSDCTSLTSVTIPSGVTSIGEHAFSGCTSLTSVTIPGSVTSIGDGAFGWCDSLTSVTIPSGVISIGKYAFASCDSLTSVTISSSVTSIGDGAFDGCPSDLVIYGETGSYAETYAKENSISFLKVGTIAGGTCGAEGDNLTWELADDGVLTVSGTGAMADWNYRGSPWYDRRSVIISVKILSGVTSIGEDAFNACDSLTSVTIPGSVTSIGEDAFNACDSLTGVTIPASVTSIGDGAFGYCDSLTAINVDSGNKNYCSVGGVLFNKAKTELLQYPEKKSGASYSIPSGVTSVGSSAFRGCTSLTSVTIPGSVTSIGEDAFYCCTSLTSVTIPGSVTSIGEDAFWGCGSLKSVTISSGVTSIGRDAFAFCKSLSSVTIPGSVTSIGYRAFCGCTSLTSVTIPGSVTSIGNAALGECGKLSRIVLTGPNIDYFPKTLFGDTDTVVTVVIAKQVTSITGSIFNGNKHISAFTVETGNRNYAAEDGILLTADKKKIVFFPETKTGASSIPEGVEEIEDGAIGNCQEITSITIPGSVKRIGWQAFYSCTSLEKVVFSEGVTTLADLAFYLCESLTDVVLPASVTYVGNGCFSSCPKLKNVTILNPNCEIYYLDDSWSSDGKGSVHLAFDKEVTLKGYPGSTTEAYAYLAGLKFVALSGEPTPAKPSQLPAPKLSKVENVNGGVKVTWGKVTGAAKYRVFYKPSGGSWAKAGDTTATSYTWKGAKSGTSYQFRVWCISADGKKATSTYDTIKTITYVAAPNYTLSTPSTGGIKLSWSKVAGASKYKIYYKTTGDWKTLTTTAETSYTVKSPKAGTKYTFRVCCVNSAGSVVSGYIADKTITYQAPAKPAQLPAPKLSKVENVNGGVKVTWGKVTGAAKYRVFYKPSGGSWAKAGDTTSTSYTWKGAKSGTSYQFRVWCISADGKTQTSTYDAIKSITYVAAPNYTLSTPPTGGIKLSWAKVTGASKYKVFYKTSGDWKTLTTTTATSYTIKSPKAGTKYTFRVRCVNSAGAVVSGYIADKTITYQAPAKPSQLSAPKLSKVENVNGGVKVTWGKVTGAVKYRVFYKPSGGSWAKAGDTTSTSYTWKGAKSGTSYQFRVQCVSSDGAKTTSNASAAKSITYIAAPGGMTVSNAANGVKISWSKVSGAAKYRMSYKTGSGSWTKITDTTATSYTWTGAKSGTSYQFRVQCVSSDGKNTTSSVSAAKSIIYIAAPKNVTVSNAANGVKVTWTKSAGAEKYRVFYKPSGGNWTKITDITATSYTWTSAKSGTSYQFRVWCVSADGKTQTSTYDGVKTITYIAAPNYTLSTLSTGGIKLSWSKVAGASKYTVFYKTTGDWKTLITTADTSYTIKSPKEGTKYTFRVRCVDSAGAVISGYITDKTITYKAATTYEEYREKVAKVEAAKVKVQKQLSRVTPEEPHTKITGICTVCSAVTLLNRKLALDGKSGQKFSVEDVLKANGCTNVKGPMKYEGSGGKKTGYSYNGDTNHWGSKLYENSSKSQYKFKRIEAENIKKTVKDKGITFEEYIAELLRAHPEGICVRSNRANHAAVITDYEEINGKIQLYAQDPVSSYDGVWEKSYLYTHGTAGGKSFISGINCIVYIKN